MNPFYEQYTDWQDSVAQYPVASEGAYLALGMVDESGEVTRAVISDTEGAREKECGDMLWYAMRYGRNVLELNMSQFLEEIDFDVKNILPINVALGIICGVEKKRIRDGVEWNLIKREQKHTEAAAALKHVFLWIQKTLWATNTTIEEALVQNQGKLNKRLEEGKIKGDGDNR